jgi:hypothetical protein
MRDCAERRKCFSTLQLAGGLPGIDRGQARSDRPVLRTAAFVTFVSFCANFVRVSAGIVVHGREQEGVGAG